jgi:hypothetical protein
MKSARLFFSIAFTTIFILGCASQKTMVPTGGSRSDGTVKLSYQFGAFEVPKVDYVQALASAKQRCNAWGYSGAEAFGGQTKTCANASMGSCNAWQVTVEYQCTGTPTSTK